MATRRSVATFAGYLLTVSLIGIAFALVLRGGRQPAPPGPAPTRATPAAITPFGTPAGTPNAPATGEPSSPAGAPVVLVGAGDIAECPSNGDEATAKLLQAIDGTVFTLGDNAYERGTADQYRRCYDPTWGRQLDRTKPVPGNHDYATDGAAGYFGYFGAAAGDPGTGWYAYDAGAWRVYALNSNCSAIGGCETGSAEERWLREDLAANARTCVLAMWHHPRFSSGQHGNNPVTQDLWQALYEAGAELIVNGHDHTYERFAPQSPDAQVDPLHGIVEFVAGTGGRSHYEFPIIRANSLVRNNTTFGVLRLTLSDGGWTSDFVPVAGGSFSDTSSGTCH
jgi:acid phosphatase type 7